MVKIYIKSDDFIYIFKITIEKATLLNYLALKFIIEIKLIYSYIYFIIKKKHV